MTQIDKYQFNPDWELTHIERLSVALTLALNLYVPGWEGATDDQLDAVAEYCYEAINGEGMKLCINCSFHYIGDEQRHMCCKLYDIVTGSKYFFPCEVMREVSLGVVEYFHGHPACGVGARYFMRKETIVTDDGGKFKESKDATPKVADRICINGDGSDR